jgi:enamine deaminase RidA (YjgF/YER057c/UK114 family)
MNALERLRALRNSGKHPPEVLTKLTKAPSVSSVSGQVGRFPETRRASEWLDRLAGALGTTAEKLLADEMILADEITGYIDRDPLAVADALRGTWPGHFAPAVLDVTGDDRRHCRTCQNLAGKRCSARGLLVMDDLSRRCLDYRSLPNDPDQRTGAERWPWLATEPP